jgi:uncharacterized protein YndB with AHSA1/START domain
MTKPSSMQVSTIIRASRRAVYQACLDPDAVAEWRVPDNMTARVHVFEARIGGRIRMSLTYRDPADSPGGGKSTEDTDTFEGRFVELVPNEKIVEVIMFESPDPRFAGEMKITTGLRDTEAGTEITLSFADVPAGIRFEDNETGTRQSLRKLAALLEPAGRAGPSHPEDR